MAIGFAKFEFVKRSDGKNACAKSAYNSRSQVEFEGHQLQKPREYNWSWKTPTTYHEILLPDHVDSKFKNAKVLWNEVEKWETKRNAQVAIEVLLALPDDAVISLEEKIDLAVSFVKKNFVEKGLAAQIDVHPPEKSIVFSESSKTWGVKKGDKGVVLYEKKGAIVAALDDGRTVTFSRDFEGYIEKEHNWHAHVILTTRRFKENGLEFEDHKARDLMPTMATRKYEKNGAMFSFQKVTSAQDWGQLWTEHQNQFFQERGFNLYVEPKGVVSQIHLGPYRMRGRAFSLLEEYHECLEDNQKFSKRPEKILESITEKKSVFTKEDLGRYLNKHVAASDVEKISEEFWKLPEVVQLAHKKSGQLTEKFTSQKVIDEETKILRLGDRIHDKKGLSIRTVDSFGLTEEQNSAYASILKDGGISMLQGFAGTGKSYLLQALQKNYEENGYKVRAFGPDSATVHVLQEKGLSNTENVHQFLFGVNHNKREIRQGKEIWIVDETGKLGNRPFLELLKEADKRNAKLILSGDAAQLPPVERGGMFKVFCERYKAQILQDIQRQKQEEQRAIAKSLATGEFGTAIDRLSKLNSIRWEDTKKDAMESLVKSWAGDTALSPKMSALMIAHSNKEVRVLNELARLIRMQRGLIESKEYSCITSLGKFYISKGDLIEFRKNDSVLGVTNGLSGVLVKAKEDRFVVAVEGKKQSVSFNPQEYHSYQLGYASTFYRAQGRTVEKAYVLHSSMINKEKFYVGLTRHVRDVLYFASKDEISCLADLKHQASRSGRKELSIDYTTALEMSLQKLSMEKAEKINSLQVSSKVLDRVKGFGLSTWDHVTGKVGGAVEKIQDRSPNREFYKFKSLERGGRVFGVSEIENLSTEEVVDRILSEEKMAMSRGGERGLSQEIKQNSHLYNTELLQEKPSAEVILILGKSVHPSVTEKISKQERIFIGFSGEMKDVKSQDWSLFNGRKVIVWSENGKEEVRVSSQVCHELRKVGMESLREIGAKEVSKVLPEKWNITKELPEAVKEKQLQQLLASAAHKGVNSEQLSIRLSVDKQDYALKAKINEVLWRVDERMRPDLEKKFGGQFWKTHSAIFEESVKILNSSKEREELQKQTGLQGEALKKLSYQVAIFEAEHGRMPRTGEMQTLKEVIRECGFVSVPKSHDRKVVDYALSRALITSSEKALRGEALEPVSLTFKKDFQTSERYIQQIINHQQREMIQQKGISLER